MKHQPNPRLLLFRKKYHIPASHVRGVEITQSVPSWGKLDRSGKVFHQRGYSKWEYNAYYDDKNEVIYVPGGFNPFILVHEIGHYVTMKQPRMVKKAKAILKSHRFTGRMLRSLGLIRYSVFSELEFLADCYRVMKLGAPDRKRNLIRFCKANGLDLTKAITI